EAEGEEIGGIVADHLPRHQRIVRGVPGHFDERAGVGLERNGKPGDPHIHALVGPVGQVARDPYLVRCAGCQVDIHAEQSAAGEVAVERHDVAGVAVGQADDAVVAQERARAHVEDADARGLQATGILEQVEFFAEVDQAVGQVDEPGIGDGVVAGTEAGREVGDVPGAPLRVLEQVVARTGLDGADQHAAVEDDVGPLAAAHGDRGLAGRVRADAALVHQDGRGIGPGSHFDAHRGQGPGHLDRTAVGHLDPFGAVGPDADPGFFGKHADVAGVADGGLHAVDPHPEAGAVDRRDLDAAAVVYVGHAQRGVRFRTEAAVPRLRAETAGVAQLHAGPIAAVGSGRVRLPGVHLDVAVVDHGGTAIDVGCPDALREFLRLDEDPAVVLGQRVGFPGTGHHAGSNVGAAGHLDRAVVGHVHGTGKALRGHSGRAFPGVDPDRSVIGDVHVSVIGTGGDPQGMAVLRSSGDDTVARVGDRDGACARIDIHPAGREPFDRDVARIADAHGLPADGVDAPGG